MKTLQGGKSTVEYSTSAAQLKLRKQMKKKKVDSLITVITVVIFAYNFTIFQTKKNIFLNATLPTKQFVYS